MIDRPGDACASSSPALASGSGKTATDRCDRHQPIAVTLRAGQPPPEARRAATCLRGYLRRAGRDGPPLTYGPLRLDPIARTAAVANPFHRLPTELSLLETFLRHLRRAFIRAELLDRCWQPSFAGLAGAVAVRVAALRRKLGDDPTRQRPQAKTRARRHGRQGRGAPAQWPDAGRRPRAHSSLTWGCGRT